MRFWNRVWCAALAMCLCWTGAHAALSPALSHMEQMYRDGTAVTLQLSVQADALAQLEGDALHEVQQLLGSLCARMTMQKQDGREVHALRLDQGDTVLLDVLQQISEDHVLTRFGPSGHVYLTAAGEKDALTLLAGEDAAALPDLSGAVRVLWDALAEVYSLLAEGGAEAKDAGVSTSIKNVGTSPRCTNYTLNGEELNTLWQDVCDLLEDAVDALYPVSAAAAGNMKAAMRSAVFSSECRFKRMYDKAGQDLGVQFTGRVDLGGDVRKVTLFGGWDAEKGFYVSLSMPAVQGDNNLKWVLGGVLKQTDSRRTLTLEMNGSRKKDGRSQSASLEGTLKNELTQDGEMLSGKMTLTRKQNGVSTVWTVSPELALSDQEMHGTVSLDVKTGGNPQAALTAYVALQPGEDLSLDSASALDLRNIPEDSQRARLLTEQRQLTRAFMYWIGSLDPDARARLTHALRSDSWMTGESVPLLEENVSYWIVEEEIEE